MDFTRQVNDLSGTKITEYATRHKTLAVTTNDGVASIYTNPMTLYVSDEIRELATFLISIANNMEAEEHEA